MNAYTLEQRRAAFVKRVTVTETCWLWTGARHRTGYGRFRMGSRGMASAHVAAYELLGGWSVPEGKELHHLCGERLCVNLDHLMAVTKLEHARLAAAARKTHCVNGHLFDAANTTIRKCGRRACRACQRERNARAMQRRMAVS